MALNATARRRWIGASLLLSALIMLLVGETLLKEHLSPVAFLLYWLLCFAFTCAALALAFLDLRALGQRAREQQRELFDATLRDIELRARTRPSNAHRPAQKSPRLGDDS